MREVDPTGRLAHEPGAKLDAGKPRAALVLGDFARALTAVAEVGTFGANKYTERGWVAVPRGQARYADAMWRHLLADAAEGKTDSDSGLPHLAHAAWCMLALLEMRLRGIGGDDQPE